MQSNSLPRTLFYFSLILAFLAACSPGAATNGAGLDVVATNSLIADVASQIAGDRVQVTVLVPRGVDPHAYEPSAQDLAAVADADLVFSNGLGLEAFLEDLLANAGGTARHVVVSDGVATIAFEEGEHHDDEEHEDEHEGEHEGEAHEDEHAHEGPDPHVWMNPLNVKVWADNIAAALADLDPQNADIYTANAAGYKAELDDLDAWAMEQIAQIAPADRQLVTDHEVFAYFAERYGFELVGAVIPGTSTLSEPSAADIAALAELIEDHGVRAVFVGFTINPGVAERLVEDTGIELVPLYSESLGEPGGPADTYIAMFRYNVRAIVEALR